MSTNNEGHLRAVFDLAQDQYDSLTEHKDVIVYIENTEHFFERLLDEKRVPQPVWREEIIVAFFEVVLANYKEFATLSQDKISYKFNYRGCTVVLIATRELRNVKVVPVTVY